MRKTGRSWTVEKWLAHWVENIAAPFVRENTIAGYRVAVNVHLIPGLGKHRLEMRAGDRVLGSTPFTINLLLQDRRAANA